LKKLLARFVRQSPSMIVAMLALFVAMGGTAIAASSILITGKQIKNSSITGADVKNKSLTPKDFRGSVRGPRGLRGLTGAPGAPGAKGDKGDKGDTGEAGPFPATLPAGKTLKGSWAIGGQGSGDLGITEIAFSYPLATAPVPHTIAPGAPAPAGCSGNVVDPGASPGHVCIFRGSESAVGTFGNYNPEDGDNGEASKQGIVVFAYNSGAGIFWTGGTWAVTAPNTTSAVTAPASIGTGPLG